MFPLLFEASGEKTEISFSVLKHKTIKFRFISLCDRKKTNRKGGKSCKIRGQTRKEAERRTGRRDLAQWKNATDLIKGKKILHVDTLLIPKRSMRGG